MVLFYLKLIPPIKLTATELGLRRGRPYRTITNKGEGVVNVQFQPFPFSLLQVDKTPEELSSLLLPRKRVTID